MGRAALYRLVRSQSHLFRSSASYSSGSRIFRSEISAAARQIQTRPTFGSFLQVQKRWASKAARAEEDGRISIGPQSKYNEDEEEEDRDRDHGKVMYSGGISSTIKKVKILSLSTCALSVTLGPVVTFMAAPGVDVILKGGMAACVMFLSASTTAALHWFVSPYVHKLRWRPGADVFEVEMMSWLASPIFRTIRFADIRKAETNRPYVSFMANNEFYFVESDRCDNKALVARLSPKESTHPSTFKNL